MPGVTFPAPRHEYNRYRSSRQPRCGRMTSRSHRGDSTERGHQESRLEQTETAWPSVDCRIYRCRGGGNPTRRPSAKTRHDLDSCFRRNDVCASLGCAAEFCRSRGNGNQATGSGKTVARNSRGTRPYRHATARALDREGIACKAAQLPWRYLQERRRRAGS